MRVSKRALKVIIAVVSVAVVCSIAWAVLYKSRVRGAYANYVNGSPSETSTLSEITITEAGGTYKGAAGSMKETVADSVPPCGYLEAGESSGSVAAKNGKGGERNPFVILEILPDKGMQQMSYLNASSPTYPIDWMKIGIDQNANYTNMSADSNEFNNLPLKNDFGYWTNQIHYGIIKIYEKSTAFKKGISFEEYEQNPEYVASGMRLVEPGRLIDLKFTDSDIEDAGYNVKEFSEYHSQNHSMTDIQQKYPNLFPKENSGKKNAIRDIAIADEKNWVKNGGAKYADVEGGEMDPQEVSSLTIAELAEKYPAIFAEDSNGKAIDKKDLKDDCWEKEYKESTTKREIDTTELDISEEDFDNMTVKQLAQKYSDVFDTDKSGKKITDKILEDEENWKKTKTYSGIWGNEPVKEGYMVNVGAGKGSFSMASGSTYSQYYKNVSFEKNTSDTSKNQWVYMKDEPEGDGYRLLQDDPDIDNIINKKLFESDESYVGGYLDISKLGGDGVRIGRNKFAFSYSSTKTQYIFTCKIYEYRYEYYGLKANDVLKRSLFAFKTQEEADNFCLQTVCMTPTEVNELCKQEKDPDNEKIDIIERADLFYIASYKGEQDLDKVLKMYQKYIDKSYTYNIGDLKTFVQDDLEWDVVIKLLKRVSDNQNLPLMFNKRVGELIENGDEAVDMYCGPGQNGPRVSWTSAVNNIGKLYLMALQFDLQAGTPNASKSIDYKRTLFGENGAVNRIYKIPLSDEVKKANGNSAQYTGYYVPVEPSGDKCCYLWNRYTFYPYDVPNGSDSGVYEEYGYLMSYLSTGPFYKDNKTENSLGSHLDGTDGESDENNVTVVRGHAHANANESSLITLTTSESIVNTMTEILYKIMHNGGGDPVAKVPELEVMKQKKLYTKVGKTQVLLDYSKDAKYKDPDKKLYIKVSVTNPQGNIEPGIVKSISLINDAEDVIDKPVPLKSIGGDALAKEKVGSVHEEDKAGTELNGYRIPLGQPLEFYVPYKLSDWQKGYTTLRFELQGMTYFAKRKKTVVSKVSKVDVLIDERALFGLR